MTTISESKASFFVDNLDGTVTDTRTNLMWMRCALGQTWDGSACVGDAHTYSWSETRITHEFARYDDWRLPDLEELRSIVALSRMNPSIDIDAFPMTPCQPFWTASTLTGTNGLYSIDFSDGAERVRGFPVPRIAHLPVRLVRGHRFSDDFRRDFIENGDGTVTDTRSGLMWMRHALGQTWDGATCIGTPKRFPWQAATNMRHDFAGYVDWRLPDIDELTSISAPVFMQTVTGEDAFPNMSDDNFWSASTYRDSSAWCILFRGDRPAAADKLAEFNVCLVRGGQPFVQRKVATSSAAKTLGHNSVETVQAAARQTKVTPLSMSKEQELTGELTSIVAKLDFLEARLNQSINNISCDAQSPDHGKLIVRAVIRLLTSSPVFHTPEVDELRTILAGDKFAPALIASPLPMHNFADVVGWLTTQRRIPVAALRGHLLPLDLLPSAVIDEINERALDLTGELALNEDDDEIVVVRDILAEALADWEKLSGRKEIEP